MADDREVMPTQEAIDRLAAVVHELKILMSAHTDLLFLLFRELPDGPRLLSLLKETAHEPTLRLAGQAIAETDPSDDELHRAVMGCLRDLAEAFERP